MPTSLESHDSQLFNDVKFIGIDPVDLELCASKS
ncbi:hypothetical protein Vi05172_g13305 [Venturia inaequalis]|nr:hypothetical protein Vi05172_g13305 [Venturia inaequalis]